MAQSFVALDKISGETPRFEAICCVRLRSPCIPFGHTCSPSYSRCTARDQIPQLTLLVEIRHGDNSADTNAVVANFVIRPTIDG
jgi:hypothetical protein